MNPQLSSQRANARAIQAEGIDCPAESWRKLHPDAMPLLAILPHRVVYRLFKLHKTFQRYWQRKVGPKEQWMQRHHDYWVGSMVAKIGILNGLTEPQALAMLKVWTRRHETNWIEMDLKNMIGTAKEDKVVKALYAKRDQAVQGSTAFKVTHCLEQDGPQTPAEIAGKTNLTRAAVKLWLSRAYKRPETRIEHAGPGKYQIAVSSDIVLGSGKSKDTELTIGDILGPEPVSSDIVSVSPPVSSDVKNQEKEKLKEKLNVKLNLKRFTMSHDTGGIIAEPSAHDILGLPTEADFEPTLAYRAGHTLAEPFLPCQEISLPSADLEMETLFGEWD